jgi:hypothetical protein
MKFIVFLGNLSVGHHVTLYSSVNYCVLLIPFYTFSHYAMSFTPHTHLWIYEVLGLSIGSCLPICESGKSLSKVKDKQGEVTWNGLIFVWPCVTDTDNIENQLDATVTVY